MEHAGDGPFFVLMNPTETHRPYLPARASAPMFTKDYSGPLKDLWLSKKVFSGIRRDEKGWLLGDMRLGQRDIDYLVARYDDSLAASDRYVGEVMEGLRKSELLYDTIVVLLADHGELLGEHGAFLHCTEPPRLYGELTHVPLIVKTPKIWLDTVGRTVTQPVELIDLMPTLLDLVRIPRDPQDGLEGRSLMGHFLRRQEAPASHPVFAETSAYGTRVQSIEEDGWKLILNRAESGAGQSVELYKTSSDPAEMKDRSREDPGMTAKMLRRLQDRWP
jgi:arylsulfatase A-like enzyme